MVPRAAFLLTAALVSPTTLAAVLDRLSAVPAGWSQSAVPDETPISLQIGLVQQNIEQLESMLMAVSMPGNAKYGQHLDVEELNASFAPSAAAFDAVQSWLEQGGVGDVHSDGHWLSFSTTVGTANSLLNTTFASYQSNGVAILRTTEYSVPDNLLAHIDLVSPTTYFGQTRANAPTAGSSQVSSRATAPDVTVDASCQDAITPSCLKQLYNVAGYTPDANSGSRIGFGSFLNESALYSDLFQYQDLYNIPRQNFSTVLINGATNNQDPATSLSSEGAIDVQNIVGVSHPLPVVEFITGGSPPFVPNLVQGPGVSSNEPFLPYYQYLLSQPNSALPQVISNSYADDEQTVPKAYAVRVCNMIGMLGLRGITVLHISGDTGIGAPCKSNDGLNTTQFTPTFPASCPYVLAVGGTQDLDPSIAWQGSAGGFSNYFTQPVYQATAVQNYLAHHISPATKQYYESYTDFRGRGFPDIAAHSQPPDYALVAYGAVIKTGGTSAAAPVVAAIIGLLNDARFRAGKPALGFVNPLLYANGSTALNDIVGGGSTGCNGFSYLTRQPVPGGGIVPWASWNATEGWDPVTGMGTPDFERLRQLVLSL